MVERLTKNLENLFPYANIHIPHLKVGDISRQDGLFSIPKVSGIDALYLSLILAMKQ